MRRASARCRSRLAEPPVSPPKATTTWHRSSAANCDNSQECVKSSSPYGPTIAGMPEHLDGTAELEPLNRARDHRANLPVIGMVYLGGVRRCVALPPRREAGLDLEVGRSLERAAGDQQVPRPGEGGADGAPDGFEARRGIRADRAHHRRVSPSDDEDVQVEPRGTPPPRRTRHLDSRVGPRRGRSAPRLRGRTPGSTPASALICRRPSPQPRSTSLGSHGRRTRRSDSHPSRGWEGRCLRRWRPPSVPSDGGS